jgi:DNA-binding CsgD family transcriptional regulator
MAGAMPAGDEVAAADVVLGGLDQRILVLDDAHWADPDTLALLPLLSGRVGLILTARKGDPGAQAALRAVDAARIDLAGLVLEDAERLLRRRRPALSAADRREIADAAGGNPFLLEELGPGGAASNAAELVLTATFDRLSQAGRDAVVRLGLLGRPAPRDLAGTGVRDAIEAGLAVMTDDGTVALRHSLIGEAAVSSRGVEERAELHAALAQRLEPGEAARHLAAAGQTETAHAHALQAAESTANPTERARHLALAATCAGSGQAANRLRLDAAEAAFAAGHPGEALELTDGIADLARGERARAEAIVALARFQLGDHNLAEAAADLALELADGELPNVEAEALRVKAMIGAWDWDGAGARPFAERALELALATGDEIARTKLVLARTLYSMDDRGMVDLSRQALDEARADGDAAVELDAAFMLASGYAAFGDPETAYAACDAPIARAREVGLRRWEFHFRFFRAHLDHCVRGAYAEAISGFRLLLRNASAIGENQHRAKAGLAVALAETGRDAEAREALDQPVGAAESNDARGSAAWARGDVHWLAGRPSEALAAAADGATIASPYANVSRLTWAWAARELGRGGDPPDPPAGSFPTLAGNLLELRALALAGDSPAQAEIVFLEAANAWRGEFLSARVRCLWAAGDAALADGDPGRAREHLLAAAKLSERLGLAPYTGRIRRSLRASGLRRREPPAAPTAGGHALLTPRESEVLDLVGDGLTSREIAARLGVAGSTVDSQVKSAMRKLDVRSRRQAVLAARGATGDGA